MPDLRSRVQADHVPDHAGRCRDCGEARWPCELYQIATEAEYLGAGRSPFRPAAPPRREPPAPREPRGDSRVNPYDNNRYGWR